MASIRDQNPIPPLAGSVDIYPDRQAVVIAHGLAYQPRPSIQSHLAYLPELAELNARHLQGERAAHHILFDIRTIDNRLPSLDDGLSWPELMTGYDVRDVTENYLVLEKAGNQRSFLLSPIGETSTSFGAMIPIPALEEGPVWAQIDVRPTMFGIVAGQLYKAPVVAITATTRDGRQRSFRMIPALARGGFLVSPLVENRLEFAMLASGAWKRLLAPAEVTRLVISVDRSLEGFYRNDLRVSLFQLDAPRQREAIYPRGSSLANLYALAAHAGGGEVQPRIQVGPQGMTILMAHAASQMVLAVDREPKRLRVGFGLLDGAWRNGGRTDGVLFRISVRSAGRSAVVWSRFLDPMRNPEDRGTQEATVEFEGRHAAALVFETLPGENGLWDWSYWSRADVE